MKKNIGIVVVLALVVMMFVTYIKKEIDQSEAINEQALGTEVALNEEVGLGKNQLAPDFTLYNLQGEKLTLSELRGKRVVLNFWATWCPPCKAEMPHMQKYYAKYSEEDNVEIVGVNLTYGKEKVERIPRWRCHKCKRHQICPGRAMLPDGGRLLRGWTWCTRLVFVAS